MSEEADKRKHLCRQPPRELAWASLKVHMLADRELEA